MELNNFKDFELSNFWEDSDYANKEYVEEYPSDETIQSIEKEIEYKLPNSYIELMRVQNGGIPINNCFPTKENTSWAEDHIAITGIMGIGRNKTYSLCGSLGSQFMIDEWGYPNIGVCVCDCPSGGHDMIMLDYTKNGKSGEPEVVHVDQESNYKITFLAKNFKEFIQGLVNKNVFDTSEQDLLDEIEKIKNGKFSSILSDFIGKEKLLDIDSILRNILTKLSNEKGYFALHADELSYLVYDLQFYLYSKNNLIKSQKNYLENYGQMIALGNADISTGGYAESFVEDWLRKRIEEKSIIKNLVGSFKLSKKYEDKLLKTVKKYE